MTFWFCLTRKENAGCIPSPLFLTHRNSFSIDDTSVSTTVLGCGRGRPGTDHPVEHLAFSLFYVKPSLSQFWCLRVFSHPEKEGQTREGTLYVGGSNQVISWSERSFFWCFGWVRKRFPSRKKGPRFWPLLPLEVSLVVRKLHKHFTRRDVSSPTLQTNCLSLDSFPWHSWEDPSVLLRSWSVSI